MTTGIIEHHHFDYLFFLLMLQTHIFVKKLVDPNPYVIIKKSTLIHDALSSIFL